MLEERYEIIKLLGKGRTGGVYEAEDVNLGRKVAMRRFFSLNNQINFSEYKEDFEKVAQSLSALQHPNLLRVYDAGVDDDGAYIISQLLEGETLHQRIKSGGIPVWEVHDLAQQMLDALSTAHAEGFVHGAITPGSILMSPRARGGYLYVILDMGLSRLAPLIQGKDSVLSVMADPAILAPELFGGGVANERADLYMLGHILYMSLAGGHPFGGVSSDEAEKMHGGGLPPLGKFNEDVPEDFRLWIEKLIKFNPDERPASAVEALNALPMLDRTSKVPVMTAPLNTSSAPQLQIPTGNVTGPVSGIFPASAIPAAVSASVAVVPSPLAGQKKSSKKGLFIVLGMGLVVAFGAILAMMAKGGEDEQSIVVNEDSDEEVEKIIFTDFDGSKSSHPDWGYQQPLQQRVDKEAEGRLMQSRAHKAITGIKLPMNIHTSDMFDYGWKLTYQVKVLKGAHKLGFHFNDKLNRGWGDGAVSLHLVIECLPNNRVRISGRDRADGVKKGNSIIVPYAGDNNWYTIVVEQQPEDESGSYSVTVDDEPAFEDTFNRGMNFGKVWNNHLFSYSYDKKKPSQWLIKRLKLETIKGD